MAFRPKVNSHSSLGLQLTLKVSDCPALSHYTNHYIFLLEYSCFTMLLVFAVRQVSYRYTRVPSFFRLPSHLGRHRALSSGVLLSHLLRTVVTMCQSQPPDSSHLPLLGIHARVLYVGVSFCLASRLF